MLRIILLITIITFTVTVCGKKGYGPGEQDWGFVDVRKGAHMFYWLYYTTATTEYTARPLAIWLQGGPGASSTGYGNFEEFGPLDLNGNYRNHTWVKDMNVVFIDNPVGSGYSYVDSPTKLTKNNKEIALDLVTFMKEFYKRHSVFTDVPLHIFSESYGGKMAPEFALELYKAIERGELKSNLKSVNLGDPWMSPIESVLSWAPLLLHMGIVDEDGHENIMKSAKKTADLVDGGKWWEATTQWGVTQRILLKESHGVDFYNILKFNNDMERSKFFKDLIYRSLIDDDAGEDDFNDPKIEDLMHGPVSEALKIPSHVKWGKQSDLTFRRLSGDFMKPVLHIVNDLLDNTNIQVSIFSGQLDLICATPGTVNAISDMNWSYKSDYIKANRTPIYVNGVMEGYEKTAGNFTMFWILRAGHMVPADNPAGMDHILRKITKYDKIVKLSFL